MSSMTFLVLENNCKTNKLKKKQVPYNYNTITLIKNKIIRNSEQFTDMNKIKKIR